jgi:hypothetical protein
MVLVIGALTALAGAVIVWRSLASRGVDETNLGWMSEHWLAEYRASHQP